jgi:hypothetical protein
MGALRSTVVAWFARLWTCMSSSREPTEEDHSLQAW